MHLIAATVLAAASVACASPSQSTAPPSAPEGAGPSSPSTEATASVGNGGDQGCKASSTLKLSDLPEAGLEGALLLHPGDAACLERRAGAVASVASAAKDSAHLALRVRTREGTTVLEVHNGFPVAAQYRALMQVEGTGGWQETSIVPVLPGLSGFETWPHPIGALALFEFQFAAEGSETGSERI
ncbi:MAG: hypothetical protein ABI895_34175 [Deltaproteobacteria bacterium]